MLTIPCIRVTIPYINSMYSVYNTLYYVYLTMYCVYFTMYYILYIVYSISCIIYTKPCIIYTMPCIICMYVGGQSFTCVYYVSRKYLFVWASQEPMVSVTHSFHSSSLWNHTLPQTLHLIFLEHSSHLPCLDTLLLLFHSKRMNSWPTKSSKCQIYEKN